MHILTLAGLVTAEKGQLAADLANHFVDAGLSVRVFDQMSRLPLSGQIILEQVTVERLSLDGLDRLPQRINSLTDDVLILAVSEQIHPDALFLALDHLALARPDLDITTLALIDTRTCDCFPNVRLALENIADVTLSLPVTAGEVLQHAGIA